LSRRKLAGTRINIKSYNRIDYHSFQRHPKYFSSTFVCPEVAIQKADPLIRTKLRRPFTRQELVPRPRLQARITEGLRAPLTLITAPAGFGKTTLATTCVNGVGLPVAWLSLDKHDNQAERFLSYLISALQEVDKTIGIEAMQLLEASRPPLPETVLTSIINDLDTIPKEIILVFDDYQFISSQAVHDEMTFFIGHCPNTLHIVIATRSDPPLPLARLRARGQIVELRAADLRFTEPEAALFLKDVMGLPLDDGSIATLADRTEGWIAGLQMASIAIQSHLTLRDREDIPRFIEGFSGTNRYILDYLLEEVLASQPPDIQHFLLVTSILERLTAPLCDAILVNEGQKGEDTEQRPGSELLSVGQSDRILDYLERANLFLTPLDDERTWYRYHHLFADLLRTQLQSTLGTQGVAQLHVRASDWHGQSGSIIEAIKHATLAADDERVERYIEQNYMEMVSRGEQSWIRFWTSKPSKELVYRRPWLCIYEAYSHSWFGELDEAERLLGEAEKRIRTEGSTPDTQAMLGLVAYVQSRISAMRGDIEPAIELCLAARKLISADNLALQLDTRITLGYEYFLKGDYANARPILEETIHIGLTTGAVINTVAASCILARLFAVQGSLHKSYDTYQIANQSIPGPSGQHLGARALVEIGLADVLYEWNDLTTALTRLKKGLSLLAFWGKADDLALAYITLARIYLALADEHAAREAIKKAGQVIQTSGLFSEARHTVEITQAKMWLALGDLQAINRWAAAYEKRFVSDDRIGFENEPSHIILAQIYAVQNKFSRAISLLANLEDSARSTGRMGRVIEVLLLKALVLDKIGDANQANLALTQCLELSAPEGYLRVFLEAGQPMRKLLTHWLAQDQAHGMADTNADFLHNYGTHLLSQFDAEPYMVTAAAAKKTISDPLIESLSQRELEVLRLIALGMTNEAIARQIIVSPGTVKAHTANIYRKLDVANRTEAVARARQFGLIS
jgi:LuxR family transcriptional regulator, maltose regulon positive regulatory protein